MLGADSDLSLYYILICIFLGCSYSYSLYLIKQSDISRETRVFLFFIRFFCITIIALLLLNPFLKSNTHIAEKPIVVIAKDNSTSIKEDVKSNLEFIEDNLTDFEVFSYSFSDGIYEGINVPNNGLKTNYSHLFSEINTKFENRNVVAVILASDGCYNTGSSPDYIPYISPVYSLALGDTILYEDIRIDKVLKNDIAFLGNTFPMEISLGSNLSGNASTLITVWNNGIRIHEDSIIFLKDVDYNNYVVRLPAERTGLQKYTIKLAPLSGEKNITNNTLKVYIDVIESRHNILILKDQHSPDIAAYHSVVDRNNNYKVEIKNIDEDFMLDRYQLLVLFGIDDIPSILLDSNIPLIIFDPSHSFYNTFNLSGKFNQRVGFEEVLACKNESFSRFLFSPDLLKLISTAPPLYSLSGDYNFQGYVDFVLNQKAGDVASKNPLILLHLLDTRKIAFVLAEGWWRWKLYDYSINNNNLAFDELFSKLSQYLVLDDDKSLFRLDYNYQYEENNEIILFAELYNDSYELVDNKEIDLKLIDENNRQYDFQFFKKNGRFKANLGVLDVGTYDFTANVRSTNLMEKGVFEVKDIQLEELSVSANHEVLRNMASLSGGAVFYLDQSRELIKKIQKSDKNKSVIHSQEKLDRLINIPWILLSLLVFISCEWFVRKYNGLI